MNYFKSVMLALLILSACSVQQEQNALDNTLFIAESSVPASSAATILQSESVITNLTAIEAKKLLDKKTSTGLFVLNVHSPFEGKIEGTDLIIEDWQNINKSASLLPLDKKTPIFVYCRSGRMSTSAVSQLLDMGYTNLYHLEGGMKAWASAGLPLLDKTFD